MRKNYLRLKTMIGAAMLMALVATNVKAQVHISTAQGLQDMQNNTAGSYILDNDIDLATFTWSSFNFNGTLNGNGFSIKNLLVEIPGGHNGLFGDIDGATVQNLGLTDVYVYANWAGALAGNASNSTISRCFVTGEVKSDNMAGGFIGHATNTSFSECYTKVIVSGHDHVGGIVGHMNGGKIENCYTNSDVYSDGWQVGGIAGWAQNAGAKITKCFAMGTVKSVGGFTGGILGIADGSEKVVEISECLALQTNLTTVNPDIEKTYRIIANHAAGVYFKNYGLDNIVISDPYKTAWENDVKGKDGASITAEQAKSPKFFADSLTWDFVNVWVLNNGILKLKMEDAPVHISTASGLQNMQNNPSGSYILDNDIDLVSFAWTSFNFNGKLNGNGFSIKNLLVEIPGGHNGMFGDLDGATVQNLGLTDVYVYANWAGALAGNASNATISRCFVTGEIGSNGIAGGLIGHASNTNFSECYTKITINGHDHVGGIVGHMNGGKVENCYTNSDVYSDGWQVGGLVGWAQNAGAKITKSYAMGTVKSVGGFTGGILGIADGSEKVVEISECLALQTNLTTVNPDIEKTYRIIANHAAGTYSKNYGLENIVISDPHKNVWENDVNGKDGASITAEQSNSSKFFADSLTWDFVNVWVLNNGILKLKWEIEGVTTSIADKGLKSTAKVFARNGSICVLGAEENAVITVYSFTGARLLQTKVKSSEENINIKGAVIITITTSNGRSSYKIINL